MTNKGYGPILDALPNTDKEIRSVTTTTNPCLSDYQRHARDPLHNIPVWCH